MTVGNLQILFALIWGVMLFGAWPGPIAGIGGLLIVFSVVGVARTRMEPARK